jgi:hypothetical protein
VVAVDGAQRKPLTADELLPLTAWIIVKGQPAHMFSVLYYVEVFLHLQGLPMAGELAYILTTYAVLRSLRCAHMTTGWVLAAHLSRVVGLLPPPRHRAEGNRARCAQQAACEWLDKGAPGVEVAKDASLGLRATPSPALDNSPRDDEAKASSAAEPAPLIDIGDEREAPTVEEQRCSDSPEEAFPPVGPPTVLSTQPHPSEAVAVLLKQQ